MIPLHFKQKEAVVAIRNLFLRTRTPSAALQFAQKGASNLAEITFPARLSQGPILVDRGGNFILTEDPPQTEAPSPAVPEVPPPPQPEPKTLEEEFAAEEMTEYERVAASLGLKENREITEAVVRKFLADEGIPTYNLGEVGFWLDSKIKYWGWLAMRDRDKKAPMSVVYTSGYAEKRRKYEYVGPYSSTRFWNGQFCQKLTYQKAIPLPVLLTAEKIQRKFPTAGMFITDEVTTEQMPTERRPDPFLGVCVDGVPMIVVAFWDEPNFGISKTTPSSPA